MNTSTTVIMCRIAPERFTVFLEHCYILPRVIHNLNIQQQGQNHRANNLDNNSVKDTSNQGKYRETSRRSKP